MKRRMSIFVLLIIASLLLNFMALPFQNAVAVLAATLPLVDDFEDGLPTGADPNGIGIGFITFRDNNSSVAISTSALPPAPVPGAGSPNNVLKMDVSVVSYAGFVHSFENATIDTWVTQDWSAYAGISFWLYGNNSGTTLFVDVLDNRNPGSIKDDAERWSIDFLDNFSGWQEMKIPFASMHRKEIGNGAPNDGFGLTEVHGWALGAVTTPAPQSYYVDNAMVYGVAPIKPLTVGFSTIDYSVMEGLPATITVKLSKPSPDPVTVQYATSFGSAVANRDFTPVGGLLTFAPNITQQSFTIQTIDDQKYQGSRSVLLELFNSSGGGVVMGLPPISRLEILDNEAYDPYLLDDFETYPYLWGIDRKALLSNPEIPAGDPLAVPGQGAYEHILQTVQKKGAGTYSFYRSFPIGQDWSDSGGLGFWYYGRNTGKDIQAYLTNKQVTDTDPSKWKLVWSDEFNTKTGVGPDLGVWGQEIGDGTVNGIPGWGNSELEYYTGGTDNVATDGLGNLKITAKEADGSLMCYYGPCQYTSARLLTKNRFEVAFGRVEARIKVPQGSGLWPAFWMLGTDIDQVDWPQTGEIDIMEYVGRVPNQVFGTLHGPGYSGGQSYGQMYDLGKPVADDFHVFAVEWQPDKIIWFIDGIPFFTATPDDPFLQGKQWVFNHPFYLLLNVAVGGNFGGPVGEDTVFPQNMLIDYVRLYQAKSKPLSFQAAFRDDFSGWQRISLPFSAFINADGYLLDTSNIQTLRFTIPDDLSTPVRLDQVRLTGNTPPPPATWSTITFDSSAVTYTLTGFGGADDSTVVVDPTNAANKVARVVKSATAELWAGTTVSTGPNFSVPALPFTASSTKMTVRVWSPDAGIQVRLKAEDAADPTKSVETEATVTTAAGWQTLTFDFANQAPGTAALNLAYTYNKVSIFFNFGVTGAVAGAKTYYFDDVAFGGTTPPPATWSTITFDSSAVTYTLTGFGGADDSTVVVDPTNAANKVARVVKSATAELWAGTTVSTGPNFSVPALPFTASSTKMTVRVWSPDAGIQVRLKAEDAADPTKSVETEATVTTAAGWQTLTFDFANQAAGTAALNLAYTYNRVSIFFNFGVTGAVAGAKTYYFDDVTFGP